MAEARAVIGLEAFSLALSSSLSQTGALGAGNRLKEICKNCSKLLTTAQVTNEMKKFHG